MKISFLGQGLSRSSKSLGGLLIESLSEKQFNKFIFFVAFASQSGINGLSKYIKQTKKRTKNLTIFVGVDQKGTSKEALEALLKLKIDTKIYFTTSHVIFHPKIYLFEGDSYCRIILGSSNLTEPGLFQNVEASLLIEFMRDDKDGVVLLGQIYDYFELFLNGKDRNVQSLTKKLIGQLYKSKIVPTENEKLKTQEKQRILGKKDKGRILKDIQKLFPSIKIQKLPKGFKRKKTRGGSSATVIIRGGKVITKGPILWQKSKLPASDVQYAKTGTHPTGGVRLTQARWEVNKKKIDQSAYFRHNLFKDFKWKTVSTNPKVETAKVPFNIEILGNNKGTHNLEIRHKPSGEAGQGNYTTLLSWGRLAGIIQKQNLKGKTFSLYGPKEGKGKPFYIEIK